MALNFFKSYTVRTLTVTILVLISISSCREKSTPNDTQDLSENADLQSQIEQLRHENELKDSLINDALAFYNEIQTNLESIGTKRDVISKKSSDPELAEYDKEYILSEIRHINFLREENAKKVNQLNEKLKNSGLKLSQMEQMINKLVGDIKARDEQIELLQASLDNLDKEYARLFDAYQEQVFVTADLTEQMNTAYYTYGTTKELIANRVIEQKNGFIGIGKRTSIASKLNQNYFTQINLTKKDEILIEGSKIRILTDHPEGSYELVPVGNNTKIMIKSPREFWKISNYLIAIVE